MNDGELMISERLFVTALAWLGLVAWSLPWRNYWQERKKHVSAIIKERAWTFVVYGVFLAVIMKEVGLTMPTGVVAFAILLIVLGSLLFWQGAQQNSARLILILSGAWLLGWPIFVLVIMLILCERAMEELPEAFAKHMWAWLGGIPSVLFVLIGFAWSRLSSQPHGIPWSILVSLLALHALPEGDRVMRARCAKWPIGQRLLPPLLYTGLGAMGSGVLGALLGLGCGALFFLFQREEAQNTWKIRLIQWVFLTISALMTISHPIGP